MPTYCLTPHPDHPARAVKTIQVTVDRSVDFLHLFFEIDAAPGAVRWPSRVGPMFRDGLWQNTCFEAFCRVDDQQGYREVNLSPSGEWAVYDFSGYRRGMSRAARQPIRHFKAREGSVAAVVDVGLGDWQLGLAAVVEEVDGTKSYWALAHAPGPPDFHNPACFTATLPAPRRA